jgi:predicted 2-oxoglutarate/Fe(II)-dependent dioxygenase YbiX
MIQIIPNFVSSDTINRLVSTLDKTKATVFPHHQNIKTINKIHYPPIWVPARKFGEITSIEFLMYEENSGMYPHIDKYSFDGDFKWTMTGILFLNDPSEYVGGELLFNNLGIQLKCPIGTYVIFPAGQNSEPYRHSVNKLTKGVRNTLVFRYSSKE